MYDHIFNEVVLMEIVTEVRWRNSNGMVAGVICTIYAVAVLIGKIGIKSVWCQQCNTLQTSHFCV